MLFREYWWHILFALLALPVVSAAAFQLWLSRQRDVNWDIAIRSWDTFIKFASAVTVAISGAMVFGKYMDEQVSAEALRHGQSIAAEKARTDEVQRELTLKK